MHTGSHRQLRVWQNAIQLVAECQRITTLLPAEERFELCRQLRRAASSVAANIAEGNGRSYRKEYIHQLYIARGSLLEADTHLEVARACGYVDANDLANAYELVDAVGRMLTRLIDRLQTPSPTAR